MLKSGGSILDANPGSDLDAIQHYFAEMKQSSLLTSFVDADFVNRYTTLYTIFPDGQVKFPHPWPPQIPPGSAVRL